MILRLEAWFAVLCVGAAMSTAGESHPCPCIPRNLCPRVFGASPVDEKVTGPMKPCSDPGTVHCCGTSVSLQEQQPSVHIEVVQELKREEQLMAFVHNAIERMNERYAEEDTQREDKSIGITKKNNFGCNTKECSDISEEKNRPLNEMNTSASTGTGPNGLFNSSNGIFSHSKVSDVRSSNGTVEKVYIVYAENPNKNNAYLGKESKAQIVLPTKEPKSEPIPIGESTTEESENEPQESSIDLIQVDTRVKETPEEYLTKSKLSRFQIKNQLHNRKSNRLQELFPKRRPPPHVPSKRLQDVHDVDIAESNLDVVTEKITFEDREPEDYTDDEDVYDEVVSTDEEFHSQGSLPTSQTQTEPTDYRRGPLPTRGLNPQPTRPEENQQTTKNALELLRSRTKKRKDPPTDHRLNETSMEATEHEPEPTAMEIDEINVKVINDMMKTNFTGRSSLRSNTASKPSRAPLKTTNNQLKASLSKNNQEPKSTESPSQPRRPTSQNIKQFQHNKRPPTHTFSMTNQNHETSTNNGTGFSEEIKVHRFQPRGRTQNTRLPSKPALPISMEQEPAFDTSRDKPNTRVPARIKPFTRIRNRPDGTTQNTADKPFVPEPPQSSEEQTKQTPSVPLSVRKRLSARERQRPRVENTYINKNKQNEEPKVTTSPETQKTTSKNLMRLGTTNEEDTIADDGESISSLLKSGQDLDGSGSDFDIQQYQSRGNGKFNAPVELETGFRPMPPMMESRELNVVGPLPGGFLDPATGIGEGDGIGLELPPPNFKTQFIKNDGSFNQNNGPLQLLPPVFQIPQSQVSITTRSQFLPKSQATETQPFFQQEEIPQLKQGDLTQIQNQFGKLKNQYDTLLNRYAETLNTYIGQYKKLINSTPPNIR